jgi:hypothetical protein
MLLFLTIFSFQVNVYDGPSVEKCTLDVRKPLSHPF